jgi:hypothetical protein
MPAMSWDGVMVDIFGAICIVAIADVVVNDLLPDRFKLISAKRYPSGC